MGAEGLGSNPNAGTDWCRKVILFLSTRDFLKRMRLKRCPSLPRKMKWDSVRILLMWPRDSEVHGPSLPQGAASLPVTRPTAYLHVLASGSKTSMVFKYVVPSKPPTAMSCPFTTARPTYRQNTRSKIERDENILHNLALAYPELTPG